MGCDLRDIDNGRRELMTSAAVSSSTASRARRDSDDADGLHACAGCVSAGGVRARFRMISAGLLWTDSGLGHAACRVG
jgi:hypothetical protein